MNTGDLLALLSKPADSQAMLQRMSEMLSTIQRHARAEGYRQGAATIRWFLGE